MHGFSRVVRVHAKAGLHFVVAPSQVVGPESSDRFEVFRKAKSPNDEAVQMKSYLQYSENS